MRKKQKRVLMVVLGVAALGLCAVQLGPILFGGGVPQPQAKPPKHKPGQPRVAAGRKNRGKAKRVAPKGRPARGAPARGRPPARAKPRQRRDTGSEWDLGSIAINLKATGRRTLIYSAATLRNPFAAPKFASVQIGNVLTRANFKLQGIVRARGTRPGGSLVHLAIIDGRVYAEGEEVARGVRIEAIAAASVVLAEGKKRVRLSMSGPSMKDLRR